MYRSLIAASVGLLAGLSASAEPRSAIPWLSDALRELPAEEAEKTQGKDTITVSTLGDPQAAGLGVLVPEAAGLPASLWQNSTALRLRFLIGRLRASGVPAQVELVRLLMRIRAPAPGSNGVAQDFLRARIDRLLAMGALEEAYELSRVAAEPNPDILLRQFDIGLLTGQEHEACNAIIAARNVEPTEAARIFCLARDGQWQQAVLSLAVARENNALSRERARLLELFLESDPEADEHAAAPIPDPMTPLDYAMLTAIGDDNADAARAEHPLAYYQLDLGPKSPPRSHIIAAEHLVAAGGAPYPILFHAYRNATPAASGSLWDRAGAVQALDAALLEEDAAAIDRRLAAADRALTPLGLRVALAREYAPLLQGLETVDALEQGRLAEILMLAGVSTLPPEPKPADPRRQSVRAILDDGYDPGPLPPGSLARAALDGFRPGRAAEAPEIELRGLIEGGKTGEALLGALRLLDAGTEIEGGDLTAALRVLRAAGLGDEARQIAIETLLSRRIAG